jgi:hypothetical protein
VNPRDLAGLGWNLFKGNRGHKRQYQNHEFHD